jgi:hypothetical protein
MSSKAEEFVSFFNFHAILSVNLFLFSFNLIAIEFYRVRRRQAAAAQEQAAFLAEKRARQEAEAMHERQQIIEHYKHSVLGDKSEYGIYFQFKSLKTQFLK